MKNNIYDSDFYVYFLLFSYQVSNAINSFLSKTEFPHRFSQSSKEEQVLSDSWSPLVNEAYNCLKKPILRANYLLTLNGRPLEENENIRLGNLYHETCFLFCEPGYLITTIL